MTRNMTNTTNLERTRIQQLIHDMNIEESNTRAVFTALEMEEAAAVTSNILYIVSGCLILLFVLLGTMYYCNRKLHSTNQSVPLELTELRLLHANQLSFIAAKDEQELVRKSEDLLSTK